MTPARRHDDDESIPRFLPDRRSGADRRSGTDRRRELRELYELAVERRRCAVEQGARIERRAPADRRRPPVAQYSWEHTLAIHRMLADPRMPVACPRCERALLLGPPEARGGVHTREVHCTGCRYSVAIVLDAQTA